MIRTQIQLTEEQYRWLKKLAREEDVSMAELIRRAVDYLASRESTASKDEIRERAKKAIGRFHSGIGDLAAKHDEYFADSILP